MQVGDLIRTTKGPTHYGIVRGVYKEPEDHFSGRLLVWVLWTDGDETEEYFDEVEVINENR